MAPSPPPAPSHPRDEALLYLEWARGAGGALLPGEPGETAAALLPGAEPCESASDRLRALAGEVSACRRCGLCEGRTQTVFGEGSHAPRLVVVGEAPGAEEDRTGRPFVGAAGQLLTRMLAAIGLRREDVFIANVLKCRPPENRNPLPHEIESCSPYLLRQLEALQPRVICCLGKFAAELLLQLKGTVSSMRGKTYRWRGAKLIVTYHPAYLLRSPSAKRPVWDDLQRLAQEYLTD